MKLENLCLCHAADRGLDFDRRICLRNLLLTKTNGVNIFGDGKVLIVS